MIMYRIIIMLQCSQSRHMEFNFPVTGGSGIGPLLRHGSKGCIDLITQLCTYDPDLRLTAKQALRHPYFKDIRYFVVYIGINKGLYSISGKGMQLSV